MSIKKITKDGKTSYTISVEGINKYTSKRIQKFKSGIPSYPMAQREEKLLWLKCTEEKPKELLAENWGKLIERYLDYLYHHVRKDGIEGFSPDTIQAKESRLKKTFSWNNLHLELITKSFVKDELDRFEKEGLSRAMSREVLKEVKATLTFAKDTGIIKENPVSSLSRKVPLRELGCLTPSEVNILLAKAWAGDHPYFMVWVISVFTGLRRSELAGLKWNDIDFKERLISINKQLIPFEGLVLHTKTNKNRKVPLNDKLAVFLKEQQLKSTSDFIIDIKDKSWIYGNQSKVLREFCEDIGITPIRHHDLRATFITQMLSDNVALAKMKEMVGHSKLSTTDRYLRKAGLELRGEADKLSYSLPNTDSNNVFSFPKAVNSTLITPGLSH